MSEDPNYSKRTAKGINRGATKKLLHDAYLECLNNNYSVKKIGWDQITSKNHVVSTVRMYKKGLSPYNDKCYISKDGEIFTVHSFGYKANAW